MANKKASLKSVRQTARRTSRNRAVVARLRTQLKKVLSLKAQGGKEAKDAAVSYVSYLDKAVKIGLVHRNKAARQKSKFAGLVFQSI